MRILRLIILAFGMLGGLTGLDATAHAAPLPVAPMATASAEAPMVAKAY